MSQFRSGKGGDIRVRSLDALLNIAQAENPRAMNVFASYLRGIVKFVEDMTLKEKVEIIRLLPLEETEELAQAIAQAWQESD